MHECILFIIKIITLFREGGRERDDFEMIHHVLTPAVIHIAYD